MILSQFGTVICASPNTSLYPDTRPYPNISPDTSPYPNSCRNPNSDPVLTLELILALAKTTTSSFPRSLLLQ